MSNPQISQHKYKKGQDLVDFFLFFIIILMSLYFVYLFLFSSAELKLQRSNFYKALSLVLQTSEELFLSLSINDNGFIHVGFLDDSKITDFSQTHPTIKEVFYTFKKPELPKNNKNQLCIKRFIFYNSTLSSQNFWVCYVWS